MKKTDDFKLAVATFTDFMQLPDGTSLISPEMLQILTREGFFHVPASTKYHGNYPGGLFAHSFAVANLLVTLTDNNNLHWEKPRSPYIVGMFHDLCKIDQYRHPKTGEICEGDIRYPVYDDKSWEYNPDTLLKGHGDKSVMLLSQFYTLTEEEIVCVRYHMGAYTEKEEWQDYTRAIYRYPNALWTHQADMIAAHIKGL